MSGGKWRSVALVGAYAARQITETRKTLFLVILLMVPPVLGIVVRRVAEPGTEFFSRFIPNVYVVFLLQVVCLFYGANLIRDGMEERTLQFLLTRPVGRPRLLLGFYLGMLAVVLPLILLSAFASFVACRAGLPGGLFGDPAANAALLNMLWVFALGGVFYSALYLLFGLVFRWPTIIGVVYVGIFEWVLGFLPGPPRALSPSGYLEVLLQDHFVTRARLAELETNSTWAQAFSVEKSTAWLALALFYAAILTVAFLIVRGKDFLPYVKPKPGES